MASIQRNEPCPCGSGKKYKRCCGAAGPPAASDVEVRNSAHRRATEFLRSRRGRAVLSAAEAGSFERALRRRELTAPAMLEYERVVTDWRDERGRGLLDLLLEAGRSIPPAELRYLEVLRESVVSVFLVERADARRVELRDLVQGTVQVVDRGDQAEDLRMGELAIARVVRTPPSPGRFEGTVTPVPADGRDETLEFLAEARAAAGFVEGVDEPRFLKTAGSAALYRLLQEAWGSGKADAAEREDLEYPFAVTELEMLGQSGGFLRTSVPELRHAVGIADAASRAGPGRASLRDVRCRRRPRGQPCPGSITVEVEPDQIDWRCHVCGDAGRLHGWRGSPWDVPARLERLERLDPREVLEVQLTPAMQQALNRAEFFEPRIDALLRSAQRIGDRVILTGTEGELRELRSFTACEWTASETPALRDAFRSLGRALGEPASATPPRLAAESLVRFATARTELLAPGTVHELEVRLEGILPPVRRRVRIASGAELPLVHAALQIAFGWQDRYHYEFEAPAGRFTSVEDGAPPTAEPAILRRLADMAPAAGDRLTYTYDPDDRWHHLVEVVAVESARGDDGFARLVEGERACPPEDAGGVEGYSSLVEELRDPDGPAAEKSFRALGYRFDPERFDAEDVARLLLRLDPILEPRTGARAR